MDGDYGAAPMRAARHRAAVWVAVALVAVGGAACGDDEQAASSPTAALAAAAGAVAPTVPAAFDVQAPLVGGGDIDLAALATRPLVLWFWAPT